MLAEAKQKLVEQLVSSSTKEELIWINGFLAGLLKTGAPPADTASRPAGRKLTIAYGTETGNAKKLASDFALKARQSGVQAKLVNLEQYRLTDLPKEEYFVTVISTQGEGDPPAGAKKFFDHIHKNGFKLQNMKYSVLALGDTSYPLFCKAGEDVDAQLNKLGGQRFAPLQKCDTDYEAEAHNWFGSVLDSLGSNGATQTLVVPAVRKPAGRKTYTGTVALNVNLNDAGSAKQTHHVEILADDVEYHPGDSLGLLPENPPALVASVLGQLQAEGGITVTYKGEPSTLYELLKKKLNICCLPDRVVRQYAALAGREIIESKVNLLQLLEAYPLPSGTEVESLIGLLEPNAPRLYSIASSPEAHTGEVHLTVARDKFFVGNEIRYGLCSDYLSQLPPDTELSFYIHKNNQFRLPDDDKDIIMVGPGTGIAPFRSFLAHRDAVGATGRNWLFFGDQHFVSDFLYQTELQGWVETGVLTRLNAAFSRDQKEKVYVQHKMLRHGQELYEWIAGGAYFYVCGAKEPMSVDVEETLTDIIALYGNQPKDAARQYVENLKEEGRYLRDVY